MQFIKLYGSSLSTVLVGVFLYQLIEVGKREELWGDIFLFIIVKAIPRHIGKNILQY
jgi:hypothetical protein